MRGEDAEDELSELIDALKCLLGEEIYLLRTYSRETGEVQWKYHICTDNVADLICTEWFICKKDAVCSMIDQIRYGYPEMTDEYISGC